MARVKLLRDGKISIPQSVANKLMLIADEMDVVPRQGFNQNQCDRCVIGYALRDGVINGMVPQIDITTERFLQAIESIGFPRLESWAMYDDADDPACVLSDYLFGDKGQVVNAASSLGLPGDCNTPKDAQKRIIALLEKAGYAISLGYHYA